MRIDEIPVGLSYEDVLLVPRKSAIDSRRSVSTATEIAKSIKLNVPLVSANMDTVTEAPMAIAMAAEGGIGIIHRFMTIEREANEVKKAKRAQSYIIKDPYSTGPNTTVGDAREIMVKNEFSGLLIVDTSGKLLGILSDRDIRFVTDDKMKVSDAMTHREKLIVGFPGITPEEALKLLDKHRLEKLPIVDKQNLVKGLITSKDIYKTTHSEKAARDRKGRLLVGAAIGVKGDYLDRAQALADSEVDVLVLDIAHGHSQSVMDAIKKIKSKVSGVPLIAGNVATKEATLDLISAGADGLKVGIGPGAACITRNVTGAGMPQLTAVMDCVEAASKSKIPIIADGGVKTSGDITKALAAGAAAVMMGSMFAGTEESPGYFVTRNGIKYKSYRGMASFGANISRKKLDKVEIDPQDAFDIVPEGVESSVPYKGTVKEVVYQLVGGIRSGMTYSGASTLEDLRKNAKFIRLTFSAAKESYEKLEQY